MARLLRRLQLDLSLEDRPALLPLYLRLSSVLSLLHLLAEHLGLLVFLAGQLGLHLLLHLLLDHAAERILHRVARGLEALQPGGLLGFLFLHLAAQLRLELRLDEGPPGVAPPESCLALGLLLFGELGQLSNLLFFFIIFILLLVFFFGFEGVLLGSEFFTLPWVR